MESKRYTRFWCFCAYQWHNFQKWLSDRENFLFVVLIFVHLLPIWLFQYFPSQDGPAHIYNSNVLHEYYFPERSLFREYYIINQQLVPNWFSQIVLAALMYIMSPFVAEKMLLSGYIILLPISMRYALQAIRPDTKFLAFLSFPFIYNFMFHMGFYNYSYGLPMFFFVVGYWLRCQKGFTLRNTTTLCFLSLLLYFCHPISLVTAYMAIAVLTVWLTLFEFAPQVSQQRFDLHSLWKEFSRRAITPLYAFLPTIILFAIYTLSKEDAEVKHNIFPTSFWREALKLISLTSIPSYDKVEVLFSSALGCLFVVLSLHFLIPKLAQRQFFNYSDGLLLLVAVYVVIYFIVPNSMFGGALLVTVNQRLNFYPFFALTLWLGTQSYSMFLKRRIQIIAAAIALILLGLHTVKYATLNDYINEYVSVANYIEPNTTILTHQTSDLEKINPDGQERTPDGKAISWRIATDPLINTSGYIATQRHLIDLKNYQAALDYFPIMFRPTLELYKNPSFQGNTIAVINYFQKIGKPIDYMLLWGKWEENRKTEETKAVFRHLQQGYELIYTSPQRGLMHLYRRQDWKQ